MKLQIKVNSSPGSLLTNVISFFDVFSTRWFQFNMIVQPHIKAQEYTGLLGQGGLVSKDNSVRGWRHCYMVYFNAEKTQTMH